MDGVAYRPLTVAFHEAGFAERLNIEGSLGLPFAQAGQTRQQAGSPNGPAQPQSLNRYSYVLNNPEQWTDPSGHTAYMTKDEAKAYVAELKAMRDALFYISTGAALTAAAVVYATETGILTVAAAFALGPAAAFIAVAVGLSMAALIYELDKYIDLVQDHIGEKGIIIAATCRGMLRCDAWFINRDTGEGEYWKVGRRIGDIAGFQPDARRNVYRPGRACTRTGGDAPSQDGYYVGDNRLCSAR